MNKQDEVIKLRVDLVKVQSILNDINKSLENDLVEMKPALDEMMEDDYVFNPKVEIAYAKYEHALDMQTFIKHLM